MKSAHRRTTSQIETYRKARSARKREDNAYAKAAPSTRERIAAYFMRRNRLTRIQRQILAFIEGRWKPKHHSDKDEQARRQLRIPAAIIMEANRFQGSKVEGKRMASIRAFLDGVIRPIAA